MIIDIHTHSFPEEIAQKAISKLSKGENIKAYSDGTISGLLESMNNANISYSVLMPVATKASQTEIINKSAIINNQKYDNILSFGGIHPDNDNYKIILKNLKDNGIKGIKLHPIFQNCYIDDKRYLNIIDEACNLDMIILIHAGFDISFPGIEYGTPKHLNNMYKQLKPEKLILAHMGAWDCWDEAIELLFDKNLYIDTSFSIKNIKYPLITRPSISVKKFCEMVRIIGSEKVLFGTDSPWSNSNDEIELIKNSGLNQNELENIFYKNACSLLNI